MFVGGLATPQVFALKKKKKKKKKTTEEATRGVLWKKVFLKISKNSPENTCARIFLLIKLQA